MSSLITTLLATTTIRKARNFSGWAMQRWPLLVTCRMKRRIYKPILTCSQCRWILITCVANSSGSFEFSDANDEVGLLTLFGHRWKLEADFVDTDLTDCKGGSLLVEMRCVLVIDSLVLVGSWCVGGVADPCWLLIFNYNLEVDG